MHRKLLSTFAFLCVTTIGSASIAQQNTPPVSRAYYWDVADNKAVSDIDRINRVKSFGAKEVHIWLNGNEKTPACGARFSYSDGGLLWTPKRLEAFARALHDAGLKPVFIFSPELRTVSYIKSLSADGGPLAVAAKVGGVDIELDIEGNGERATPCLGDGLDRDAADQQLLDAIRQTSPTSKIIMSTTTGWVGKHPILTEDHGADAISPQLYGAHYADTVDEARAALNVFLTDYPKKPLWVGLSAECSVKNAKLGHCSETLFDNEVKLVAQANTQHTNRVPKYVVWGEREARRCPARPLCSLFAEDYLKRTAGQ
jgi:hypothetical protein